MISNKTYKVYFDNSTLYIIRSPSKLGSTSELDYYFKIPRNYIENKLLTLKRIWKKGLSLKRISSMSTPSPDQIRFKDRNKRSIAEMEKRVWVISRGFFPYCR